MVLLRGSRQKSRLEEGSYLGPRHAAIQALVIANEYLNAEVERLRASQSVSEVE